MPKSYERQPYDTDNSWRAFQDYLVMPLPRTIDGLFATYTGTEREKSETSPPTKSIQTVRTWCTKKNWTARAKQYDLDASAIATEKALQLHAEQSIVNVERFNKEALNSGRNGLLLCAGLKNSIRRFALGGKGMPPPRAGEAMIRTWTDAGKAARIIQSVEASSYRMYAQALGVDQILPLIEPDDEE